jgi:hypothetical protein
VKEHGSCSQAVLRLYKELCGFVARACCTALEVRIEGLRGVLVLVLYHNESFRVTSL